MRSRLAVSAGLLAVWGAAAVCGAQTPGSDAAARAPASRPVVTDEVDAAVRKALDEPMERLEVKEALLPTVFDAIKGQVGANLVVDWRAIAEARVPDDLRVTVSVRKVTLNEALLLISRGRGMTVDLGCYAVGPNVVITTQAIASARTLTQAHEIGDLLKAVVERMRTPATSAPAGGIFGEKPAEDLAALEARAAQALLAVVASTVEPKDWRVVGDVPGTGTNGTLSYHGGKLVVRHNIHVQRAVADLLRQLRETTSTRPRGKEPLPLSADEVPTANN